MAAVSQYPTETLGPTGAHSFRARDGTMVTYDPESRTVTLPDLRTSDNMIDKSKPLPTSLQSDFLPDDLLLAITAPPPIYEKLGPPSRYRNLDVSATNARKKPAGVWTHPKRRDKFKHLTENTPCVCGAGKDISFLYDVPKKEEKRQKSDEFDPTEVRKDEEEEEKPKKKAIRLPDTLIPEEYHVVKNKGVMGLEYYEDNFGTQPNDHEAHLVMFPSMNPTSRYEVVQLKKTLQMMLEKAGLTDDDFELKGPTQMHNLLEIIKKEQNIYNIIFHELIRQASVECLERGELLSEIRTRYNTLINKIPRQIKGLHEEVLAQRALDRRLTEELMRFKTTISMLTDELSEVREHDKAVTEQAVQAQEDLKSALAESQKNAGLLAEYHELYELQRRRLEGQLASLGTEKEIWSTAAYSLALKVTEEHSLSTARRLHVCEKSWSKLANHFTIMLSDQDTAQLTQLQGYVDHWREIISEFHTGLKHREEYMREQLNNIQGGIKHWINFFTRNVLSQEGHFNKPPEEKKIAALFNDIKKWESILSSENEKFGGDLLLTGEELLKEIRGQVSLWTDCALHVFSRHQAAPGERHPDQEEMDRVNDEVELLVQQFTVRLTGENGTAIGVINTGNGMEQWDVKLTAAVHGKTPLSEQDWLRLYNAMDDWLGYLHICIENIGNSQKEEERAKGLHHVSIDVQNTIKMVQKWLSSTTNSIDSEDAKLVEAVNSLHTEMIKWMVQVLLRLAPDRPDHSAEARDAVLLGSTTVAELNANAKSLFQRLFNFSAYVTQCCSGIVNEHVQQKITEQDDDPERELRELHKLQSECDGWITTAKLLLDELGKLTEQQALQEVTSRPTGAPAEDGLIAYHDKEKLEPQERPPPLGIPTNETSKPELQEQPKVKDTRAPEAGPPTATADRFEVIAGDRNTYGKSIDEIQREKGDPAMKPKIQSTAGPDVPDTKKAFEALAAVTELQNQLLEAEERAQRSEERATTRENELKDANEQIRELERRLAALENAQSVPTSASTRPPMTSTQTTNVTEAADQSTDADKSTDQSDKNKKASSSSRSSSRTSAKAKKK